MCCTQLCAFSPPRRASPESHKHVEAVRGSTVLACRVIEQVIGVAPAGSLSRKQRKALQACVPMLAQQQRALAKVLQRWNAQAARHVAEAARVATQLGEDSQLRDTPTISTDGQPQQRAPRAEGTTLRSDGVHEGDGVVTGATQGDAAEGWVVARSSRRRRKPRHRKPRRSPSPPAASPPTDGAGGDVGATTDNATGDTEEDTAAGTGEGGDADERADAATRDNSDVVEHGGVDGDEGLGTREDAANDSDSAAPAGVVERGGVDRAECGCPDAASDNSGSVSVDVEPCGAGVELAVEQPSEATPCETTVSSVGAHGLVR